MSLYGTVKALLEKRMVPANYKNTAISWFRSKNGLDLNQEIAKKHFDVNFKGLIDIFAIVNKKHP